MSRSISQFLPPNTDCRRRAFRMCSVCVCAYDIHWNIWKCYKGNRWKCYKGTRLKCYKGTRWKCYRLKCYKGTKGD